ncbi:uncharacterized protein LOC126680455 isoform X1 [Mercurialis annua]|uniref:uncharacterized protein LOC126680455 isoform X1 n=1 Tax=Mercurialis annua TaxID=3986 RepID=UPI00215E190C|nr:uncharacterized protein LOC126680455 isoform X1 [Mercurialis annua]
MIYLHLSTKFVGFSGKEDYIVYRDYQANMDDEALEMKAWKTNHHRKAASLHAITIRITMSLFTMVMLLWSIRSGFKLATDSSRYSGYSDWVFAIGVLTMLLGFLFLLLGIPILADLFLNMSDQLQEEDGIHKAWETKTVSKVIIAGIFVTVITAIILWWAIYTGFRLATEPKRLGKNNLLTTSIGVVTIIFGLIYFIIGLGIIAELGLDLFDQLQQKDNKWNWHPSRLKLLFFRSHEMQCC